MENMDKESTVSKWVLINWPKMPEIPQNLFAQIGSAKAQNFGTSMKKGFNGRS